jgi:hypothetical protein
MAARDRHAKCHRERRKHGTSSGRDSLLDALPPLTYMLNGKQFIVVPTGGANLPAELIALRLP